MSEVGQEQIELAFRPAWWERVLWLEPLWVLVLAPGLLLPEVVGGSDGRAYWVLALFGFWPLRLAVRRRLWEPTPLDGGIWFILLWTAVSLWVSVDRAQSWEQVGYLAVGVALFTSLSSWLPARRRPELCLWLLLAASCGVLAVALLLVAEQERGPLAVLQAQLYALVGSSLPALMAALGVVNVNLFAAAAALVLPVFVALCLPFRRRDGWFVPLWLVGLGYTALLLVASRSRGGLLAGAVAVAVVIVLRWPRLLVLSFLAPLVGAALYSTGGAEALSARWQQLWTAGGMSGRLEIWYRAMLALEDFALTGMGFGLFGKLTPALYPYGVMQGVDFHHAHNLVLQVGMDLGVPGLIGYVSMWMGAFVIFWRIWRRHSGTMAASWAIGAMGAMVALWTNGLIDAAMWGTKLMFLPWLLLAFACCIAPQGVTFITGRSTWRSRRR